jgi:hypothetical protein
VAFGVTGTRSWSLSVLLELLIAGQNPRSLLYASVRFIGLAAGYGGSSLSFLLAFIACQRS